MKSRRTLLLTLGSLCSAGLAGCTNLPLPYVEYYDNDPPTLEEKRRFVEGYREAYDEFQRADSLYQSAASIFDSSDDYAHVVAKSRVSMGLFDMAEESFNEVLYEGPEMEDSVVRRWTYNGLEKSRINYHASKNLAEAGAKAQLDNMDRAAGLRRHAGGLRDRSDPMEMGPPSKVRKRLEVDTQQDG